LSRLYHFGIAVWRKKSRTHRVRHWEMIADNLSWVGSGCVSTMDRQGRTKASQIQKVSAQLEVNKPAPKMAVNNQ
jgi:hypothetical protein